MNRTRYYNYIEERLNFLAYRIEKRGKINLLDLNIHSETFFAELFNILYNYNLVNLNYIKQNTEGIDLIDTKNKIIIQVSATFSNWLSCINSFLSFNKKCKQGIFSLSANKI